MAVRRSSRRSPSDVQADAPPARPAAAGEDGGAKEQSFPDRSLLRLYANLCQTVERRYGTQNLGAHLLKSRKENDGKSFESVAGDEALARWLMRLGVVAPSAHKGERGKIVGQFMRELGAAVSRTPIEAATAARVFVAGLPESDKVPVCGATPQCADCLVTRDCDYHNAPARPVNDPISPLKRLARDGASSLGDEELVAMVAGNGRATDKDLAVARELLARYGTLRGLFTVGFGELTALRVLSEATAARLAAAGELHMRLIDERRYFGPTIRTGADFFDLYHPKLRELKKEVFMLILMDQRSRVMKDLQLSEGTLTYTLVHPREVFLPAIREAAAMVALVHNHPSGDSTPSAQDITLTRQIDETAKIIQIPLLDHIVIVEGGYTSMVDLGILKPPSTYQPTRGNIIP